MSARKLLVVTDGMEVGGSQRQICYLLDGLDPAQWRGELLFFRSPSFLVAELQEKGFTIHHIPKRGRFDLRFLLGYAALLRRGRYDLIHAFSLTAELWTALARLLALRHAPLVSSVRGLYLDQPSWFWRLKRFVINRSTAVIANARAGAHAAALRSGTAIDLFDVVPNGVAAPRSLEIEGREARRRELGLPVGRPFGLFVGRMVKEKNLGCLVRALAGLDPDRRPWVALAGDGPLRAEVEASAAAAGLHGDMHFLGERSDSQALMQAADFLVLPSAYEGMPNVVLEAMMSGCPVIGSEVGGIPELVEDGLTGLLFPSNDAPALGALMQQLGSDAALRERLAMAARERAQAGHSVDAMVTSTVAVYDRCLARRAPILRQAVTPTPLQARTHDPDQRPSH